MVARERLHPSLIFLGPFGQSLLGDGINPVYVTKDMEDVLRPREQRQVSLEDHAVETVVYQSQQAAKQLGKGFHGSSFDAGLDTHIIGPRTDGIEGLAACRISMS